MKLDGILIILIFNAIFWSLINSVKHKKGQNRVEEASKDLTKGDGAESSGKTQIQKYDGNANGATKDNEKLNIKEYMKIYRQNNKEKNREYYRKYLQDNKEKMQEYYRKYRENNKEKLREYDRKYSQNNKEKKRKSYRIYYQNNKEKERERTRKRYEKRKNKKADLQNVQSNNGETSFVNTPNNDVRNKGKLPIVYEESIRSEEENHFNQGGEDSNKDETETYVDEENQKVVEEPNKIPENCMNQINLNEYPFDLNEKPEDEDEGVC
uniref:Uncharacterized protein n=1 Tax=Meloidogyne incognita TaxID=6306 RepID=A0A914N1U0_MELIC